MKKSHRPQTRVKNPEPKEKDDNWIIWAAWADRITFEAVSYTHLRAHETG